MLSSQIRENQEVKWEKYIIGPLESLEIGDVNPTERKELVSTLPIYYELLILSNKKTNFLCYTFYWPEISRLSAKACYTHMHADNGKRPKPYMLDSCYVTTEPTYYI